MNPETKAILRDAGARAGLRQRRQKGMSRYVSDPNTIQRSAELLRKVGERT